MRRHSVLGVAALAIAAVAPASQATAQSSGMGQQSFDGYLQSLRQKAYGMGISPRTLRYKLAQMRDAGMDVEAYLFAAT